ncbi:vegetative incompatibility protein HET-E-1 [Pyrenophora tritici-repentis]|nr:vegetative incompatibility protein HET-E-1 [Pyrenophora tritici-repentis]
MAAPIIEAKSLSTLTALAFNPPAYPRNPTHVRHEPLVLYIARVPGSRDVFLSPMKPRDKVVTAEDITSSLYYVHVEQPEDANLVDRPAYLDDDFLEQGQSTSYPASAPPVQRKAVPGVPAIAVAPARKPVPGALAPINNYSSNQNIKANQYAQSSGAVPDLPPRRSYDSTQYRQENKRPEAVPRRRSMNPPRACPALTLIRRDPASGAQWNVARIEDPPVLDISSTTIDDPRIKKKIGAPMYIEIFNPGYSKFLYSDTGDRPPLPTRNTGLSVRSHEVGQAQIPASQMSHRLASENTFRRRIWMEGSQHGGGSFGHRKNTSHDYNTGRPSSKGSYNGEAEMRPTPTPSFLTREDQTYGSIQVSDRQTSFRGYVFSSPWDGRCEFITGVGGGSLKCRHIVPGLQGAPPTAATVSELRFNLPSSPKGSTPTGEATLKRSSIFRRGRHSRNNSSLSIDRNDGAGNARNPLDRYDLSLGQEFAGGGLGGKQAKLGKMILEDEGLKMMDLLVAANMALWWRAQMRLLYTIGDGGLGWTEDLVGDKIPSYAILSHTWGGQEATFKDLRNHSNIEEVDAKVKEGYRKIFFCAQQAKRDSLDYFWVDTCCIDKTNSQELQEAINSMFRWYQNAKKCYVYLPDELLAPASVTFYSKEGDLLGDKQSLKDTIHEITGIPIEALSGKEVSNFSVSERFSWAYNRQTTRPEDRAYCLLGIFGIHLPLIYSEGKENALKRLRKEIRESFEQVASIPADNSDARSRNQEERLSKICSWLSAPDPSTNYHKAYKQRQAKTGFWLLESAKFTKWKESAASRLWLYGIPGCGKTILSSTIIEHLLHHCRDDTRMVAAYFYFDFNDAQKQDPELMLRSLLCQSLQRSVVIPKGVDALFLSCENGLRKPSLHALLDVIRQVVQEFAHVYIILDALDECSQRLELMDILKTVAGWQLNSLHLLMTSRKERDIERSLEGYIKEESAICL